MPLLSWPSTPVVSTLNHVAANSNSKDLRKFLNTLDKSANSTFGSEIDMLSDRQHRFVIVRPGKGKPIAAYALLRLDGEQAELEQIYAKEKGHGYGRTALVASERVAKAAGAKKLWLHSVPDAVGFYAHEGYGTRDGMLYAKNLALVRGATI